jgi:hypothetical protein
MSILEDIEKASQKLDKTDLSGVIKLSKQIVDQSKIVDDLANALRDETKKLNKLRYEDLPELMNELDIVSQEIEVDGKVYKIAKAEKFFASITKEKRPFIISWLRNNNHAGLVKNEIIASVGKGKDNLAADVCAYIEKAGLDYTREENVHTGSFKALVKDEISKGANVPLEELGVNRVVEATIKEVIK